MERARRAFWAAGVMSLLLAGGVLQADTIGGPYVSDANTIGLYHLDEGSGAAVADASAGNLDGALYGLGNTWTSSGKYGGGLQIGGEVGKAGGFSVVLPATSTANFSLEAWVNPTAVESVTQYVFGGTGPGNNMYCRVQTDGKIAFGLYDATAGAWREVTSAAGVVTNGAWTHIAITSEDSKAWFQNMSLYVNNVKVAAQEHYFASWTSATITELKIGRCPWYDTNEYFNGTIDEVRLSDVARTDFTVPEPSTMLMTTLGLAAFWNKQKK